MDGYEKKDENEKTGREEIFSKVVRAGKRTYFLDVKATRRNDYYLTITESKKRFNKDGRHYFEKHKVFLYKEDFDKFTENLQEVISFIKSAMEKQELDETTETKKEVEEVEAEVEKEKEKETSNVEGYSSNVEFDDLGDTNE